jgi:diguanylate cyclase (GGDEF)-like protein/PAS domain S-box-containing protein/putative nucleotidyltransferase with HDIG domain
MMKLDSIFLSEASDIMDFGLIITDNQYNIITVNDYAKNLFKKYNYNTANASQFVQALTEKERHGSLKDAAENIIKNGGEIKKASYFKKSGLDKGYDFFQLGIKCLKDQNDIYLIITFKEINDDFSEANKIRESAFNSLQRLRNFIDNTSDCIFVLDNNLKFKDANKAAEAITGYPKNTLLTLTLFDITPRHQQILLNEALSKLKETKSYGIESQYVTNDKKIRFWSVDFVKISDTEFITFNKDISDKMAMQEKLQYSCYHDHNTGLYNRRYITKLMLDYEKNENVYPLSVIVGDINGLKVVNDAFGRYAGDTLIKRTAQIIEKVCSPEDLIGQWGGDEFIIISPNSSPEKVTSIISGIKSECEKNNSNIKLSISLGFKIKYNKYETFDDVLKAAENMMLENKIYEGASFRSQAIDIILGTLHEKNKREEQHSIRVSRICVEIGKAMNLPQNEINKLKVIGLLHDIGKIGISEAILNKNGKLTEEEFNEIKKHSEIGYRILSSTNQTSELAQDVLDHHERFDGKGYPKGTPGYKLSTMAKTLTIADSYDAMTSERPYKAAMSKTEAIEELKRCSGKQFDPYIVDIFINNVLNNPASEI